MASFVQPDNELHTLDDVDDANESEKTTIRRDRGWSLSELDLEWIAEGCGVMGTGGGGSTYPPFLMARQLLRDGREIIVVDPEDVAEDAVFLRCMFMGAPSVSVCLQPSNSSLKKTDTVEL